MTTYVGEVQAITVLATDPVTLEAITDLTGQVEFYNPTKNPKLVVADRTPDHTLSMTYDTVRARYVAFADTTGWAAGKWSYRVSLSGSVFNNWEYGTFTLKQ